MFFISSEWTWTLIHGVVLWGGAAVSPFSAVPSYPCPSASFCRYAEGGHLGQAYLDDAVGGR